MYHDGQRVVFIGNAHSYAYANCHTDTNSNSNADTYANDHSNSNTNLYTHAHSNANSHPHADIHTDHRRQQLHTTPTLTPTAHAYTHIRADHPHCARQQSAPDAKGWTSPGRGQLRPMSTSIVMAG